MKKIILIMMILLMLPSITIAEETSKGIYDEVIIYEKNLTRELALKEDIEDNKQYFLHASIHLTDLEDRKTVGVPFSAITTLGRDSAGDYAICTITGDKPFNYEELYAISESNITNDEVNGYTKTRQETIISSKRIQHENVMEIKSTKSETFFIYPQETTEFTLTCENKGYKVEKKVIKEIVKGTQRYEVKPPSAIRGYGISIVDENGRTMNMNPLQDEIPDYVKEIINNNIPKELGPVKVEIQSDNFRFEGGHNIIKGNRLEVDNLSIMESLEFDDNLPQGKIILEYYHIPIEIIDDIKARTGIFIMGLEAVGINPSIDIVILDKVPITDKPDEPQASTETDKKWLILCCLAIVGAGAFFLPIFPFSLTDRITVKKFDGENFINYKKVIVRNYKEINIELEDKGSYLLQFKSYERYKDTILTVTNEEEIYNLEFTNKEPFIYIDIE